MKNKRIRLFTIVFAVLFVLTGCAEPLHELTPEEEELIVHYSAYAVAKFNIYQKDGMTSAEPTEEDLASVENESKPQDDNQNSQKQDNDNDSETQDKEPLTTAKASLAQAVGQENLTVTYTGLEVSEHYQEGGYFSLDASSGCTYAIMSFKLENKTQSGLDVDAFTLGHSYSATIAGSLYKAENTFLTYSLSTYQGTINAGESVDVVLLFEVPKGTKVSKEDVTLYANMKGTEYLVE